MSSEQHLTVDVTRSVPKSADAHGVAVATSGAVPRQLGLNRAALADLGFTGAIGQTLVVPKADGATVIAVGVGDPDDLTANGLRDAAAAFLRAAGKREHLSTNLADLDGVDASDAGRAVVEGVWLAAYRYVAQKNDRSASNPLSELTLLASAKRAKAVGQGAAAGLATADAQRLARELANTPPSHLTAKMMAAKAASIAADHGLGVEIYDRDRLAVMGCGGILGVNAGSTEPPRMVKLTWSPRNPTGHVVLVGKGVMYDSGGISLKPSNEMHAAMKMDMSGAAAVLATMSALESLRCRTRVTAYLMCTDNMPSGSAMKLGDVLTIRNGKTVEIHNTDAEGRLILADGLSLAVEEEPDAIVDIATLTGAAMGALGTGMAAVLGSDQALVDRVRDSAERTDESVWQLPLERTKYRKLLDSVVADMRNIGGPYAGAITAAIFLSEFTGEVPWAHLDIAGPMKVDADESWRSKGATGFGTRLLIDLVISFRSSD